MRFAWRRSSAKAGSIRPSNMAWPRCIRPLSAVLERCPERSIFSRSASKIWAEARQRQMNESMKIAFIFPGQGSQAVGMGKELAEKYPEARQTFEEADEALGYKLSQLCFEGPEEQLRLTEITQPAILTTSVAALRVLQSRIAKP